MNNIDQLQITHSKIASKGKMLLTAKHPQPKLSLKALLVLKNFKRTLYCEPLTLLSRLLNLEQGFYLHVDFPYSTCGKYHSAICKFSS